MNITFHLFMKCEKKTEYNIFVKNIDDSCIIETKNLHWEVYP